MKDRDKILAKILTETSLVHFEQNGKVTPVITEEHDALQCLLEYESVTRKMIASSKTLFTAQRNKRTKRLILRSPGLGGDALRGCTYQKGEKIDEVAGLPHQPPSALLYQALAPVTVVPGSRLARP